MRNSSANGRVLAPADGNASQENPVRASNNGPLPESSHKPTTTAVQLEPIENYKGKSVEELEAILDAYNA